MKNILLLILTTFLALNSYGQGEAPLLLRGQAQTTNQVGTFLRLPNYQVTRLSGATGLLETGNKNILANPGFEHQTYLTSWTTSGTATFSEETSTVLFGVKSFEVAATAQTFNLSQDSTLYQAQYADGIQGVASVWVNNTNPEIEICSRQAGSDIDCVEAVTDGAWHFYSIPMLLGSVSNGIAIKGASGTGTTFVDEAFVGVIDLNQSQVSNLTMPKSYTPTLTNIGNAVASNFRWWRVGNLLFLRGTVTIGSTLPNATGMIISMPSGISIPATDELIGYAGRIGSVNTFFGYIRSASTSSFSIWSPSSAGSWKNNTPLNWANGDEFEVFIDGLPIDGWRTSESSLSSFCQDIRDCTTEFSAKTSSSGVVSDESLDWIDGNCSNPSTGNYTCNFNSGVFTVTPNCWVVDSTASQHSVGSVSASSVSFSTRNGAGSLVDIEAGIACQKQGADFINAKNPVIVGTFKGVNTSPGSDRPKTCSFYIGVPPSTACTSSPCTISNQVGNCLSEITRNSTGEYVLTWNTNYWTQTPGCNFNPVSGGEELTTIQSITGTTSMVLRNKLAGSQTDRLISGSCHGF